MEREYAQALWKMVEGGMAPSKAVTVLRKALEHHGRLALLPRIKRALVRLAERESKKNDLILSVAREKDEHGAHAAAKKALAARGVENAVIKTHLDDSIIGGWRLEGKGMLVDMSYKSQLLAIYQRVVGA